MKRWIAIVLLLGAGVAGFVVPHAAPPGGCFTEYLSPDSIMLVAASCDGSANDTMTWRAPSNHRDCQVRIRVDMDSGRMEVAKAACRVLPASVDRRAAFLTSPEAP